MLAESTSLSFLPLKKRTIHVQMLPDRECQTGIYIPSLFLRSNSNVTGKFFSICWNLIEWKFGNMKVL